MEKEMPSAPWTRRSMRMGPDPAVLADEWIRTVRRIWEPRFVSRNRFDRAGKKSLAVDTRRDSEGFDGRAGIGGFYIAAEDLGETRWFAAGEEGSPAVVWEAAGPVERFCLLEDGWFAPVSAGEFAARAGDIVARWAEQAAEAYFAGLAGWQEEMRKRLGSPAGEPLVFADADIWTADLGKEQGFIEAEGRKGRLRRLSWHTLGGERIYIWRREGGWKGPETSFPGFGKFRKRMEKMLSAAEAAAAEKLRELPAVDTGAGEY